MRVAGCHAAVEWQASQRLELWMCVGFLPVAVVPLWQLAQVPVTPAWSKCAGRQAMVVWQVSQLFDDWTCCGCLPVAALPSWQL